MLRLSQYLRDAVEGRPVPRRRPAAPVVIWNLIRRCNLRCSHCYTASADRDFAGELGTAEALAVVDDLAAMRVPALILSGGEPLLRPDLMRIVARAKAAGIYVGLSTNGTLVDAAWVERLAGSGLDYVGISLDGLEATHDRIRGREGAFAAALAALERLAARGLRVGARFTLTRDNALELPDLMDRLDAAGVRRFYLSHLNYAGRGRSASDAHLRTTREVMHYLCELAWLDLQTGREREIVTGNNDADGVFLLHWLARRAPEHAPALEARLRAWGGNASGIAIANIDNRGWVHPDSFWWDHRLGNVRERPFSEIWRRSDDALLAGLRARPRPLKGRCAACRHLELCNGNTRVRAKLAFGDPWAEDPGCYLTDAEIGLGEAGRAVA
ncbi:heme d1 biosynthesis radical SAM protein NirJ [Inmirania thermothiophila]|uniref:Pre-heme d1 synthase n=1 Tax=Inmirania thermothiophila TaxID=1750597 RepID=A0A3N1XSA9_9GAMM|nr:heme d1 biosynthesis radical SAM protein NirJ [Inmirania thermothiophila]ROR29525.1 heme d1 biosynthesis radical SAM protein NirJ [Inmirania thermothiophila]